jgi:hypothetical protein
MTPVRWGVILVLCAGLLVATSVVRAQRGGMFRGSIEDPAIAYTKGPLDNPVADLNTRLADGSVRLTFEGRSGYLQSVLDALRIPVDSQVLVFSPNSLQARRITPTNPRALFFNDRVALGWVRDGELLEVAVHDATQGVAFYTLEQRAPASPPETPQFKRGFICLGCHIAGDTLGVPGLLMFSALAPPDASGYGRFVTMDHRTPIDERWGGWFVTGTTGTAAHRGNEVTALDASRRRDLRSAEGLFDLDGYRTASSDVAALMVLSHQTHMVNLLTRLGWEARAADPRQHAPFTSSKEQDDRVAQMLRGVAVEVVDYLLFVDEVPLSEPVQGSSAFAERFSSTGPRDKAGRSLHELDLRRRVMKYPCSYLIYSPAFDALPPAAKEPLYQRMWAVLSGAERGERYQQALSRDDRRAVVEILRDTKPGLPSYFNGTIQ